MNMDAMKKRLEMLKRESKEKSIKIANNNENRVPALGLVRINSSKSLSADLDAGKSESSTEAPKENGDTVVIKHAPEPINRTVTKTEEVDSSTVEATSKSCAEVSKCEANASKNTSRSFNKSTIKIRNKEYTLLNTLGKGGTSIVFQAFSHEDNLIVAIKCVDLSKSDRELRVAYENEIKLLKDLQGSPNVVKMFDFEIRRTKLFVVLERGDIDLASFMQKKYTEIDDKFIKYHWQEMLRCVKVIHDRHIVHSDLKPANFLFVGGSLKLIDFGIASNIPANHTSAVKDIQIGTLNYMSPEAINGSYTNADGSVVYKIPLKSDVWSLGCILYAIVYGKTPFHHITNQIAKMNAISSDKHKIEFPPLKDLLLLKVLKKCLVRDVRSRASIDDLLDDPYLKD